MCLLLYRLLSIENQIFNAKEFISTCLFTDLRYHPIVRLTDERMNEGSLLFLALRERNIFLMVAFVSEMKQDVNGLADVASLFWRDFFRSKINTGIFLHPYISYFIDSSRSTQVREKYVINDGELCQ